MMKGSKYLRDGEVMDTAVTFQNSFPGHMMTVEALANQLICALRRTFLDR